MIRLRRSIFMFLLKKTEICFIHFILFVHVAAFIYMGYDIYQYNYDPSSRYKGNTLSTILAILKIIFHTKTEANLGSDYRPE